MIVKCGACKEDIEIQDGLVDGTYIRCPYCNEKTKYTTSSSITLRMEDSGSMRPSRIAVPTDGGVLRHVTRKITTDSPIDTANKPRLHIQRRESALQSSTSVSAQKIMERMQNREIKEKEAQILAMSEQRNLTVVILLLVICVIAALTVYWWNMRHSTENPSDTPIKLAEKVIVEDSNCARQQAEENAEREQRRKEADAERARRKAEADAEREKKRLIREKEVQQQKEKAEEEKENRERIEDIEQRFKVASFVFASDFAADKLPTTRDGTFYAVGLDYISDKKIYEAMVEHGVVVAARIYSPKDSPTDIAVKVFTDSIMRNKLILMGDDGIAWIYGTGKPSWTESVSLTAEPAVPAKVELGELFAILSSWGRLPDLKYRLTLKVSKNGMIVKGGREIALGIIGFCESISREKIRDAILKTLQKKREKAADIKPPKLRKFNPTVVFYDGNIVRREINDITKVPRTWCRDNRWESLKAEAERQERMKEKTARENEQLMREHAANIRAILSKGITGEEIESETRKYLLLIERSHSRLPQ